MEIHSPDAFQIYQGNFEDLILHQSSGDAVNPSASSGGNGTSAADVAEVPKIKASKSTQDNLRALLDTEWAKQGRTNAELTTALEANAVPDKPNRVSNYLARLVKANIARRMKKEDGVYHFYPLPKAERV